MGTFEKDSYGINPENPCRQRTSGRLPLESLYYSQPTSLISLKINRSAVLSSLPTKRCGNSKNLASRYIPKAVKLFVWKRDKGSCTYVNQNTGQRCNSQFQIQYDHILPFSQKVETIPENLRLLCAHHNRYEAIEKLGHEKMQRYLEKDLQPLSAAIEG